MKLAMQMQILSYPRATGRSKQALPIIFCPPNITAWENI